ncbi:lysophospholipid acyltransferase family protein [Pseudemcibacter aquimaris]|uniref:lysophospholipid acyltransferase family protein n=1 Tax=Pseudemcibacter aquimaris TaxID=2857064 RepID=UPI0020131963|nr:lysophospholipid acyltransferase family protein [Pseudemcibacter aquimaris]MCC3862352.1 1-acyl-sn-glycerol-3-phosphate acyltransferase [Pseudemcibacter aquimaris]WDU59217.1 1-acyl-sn-glycerol-3-phosphate acyltransferase [Pseudemcibacter aquimaris]
MPPTILLKKLKFPGYKAWPHLVHRSMCKALDVRVKTFGHALEGSPTLFVSNHVSYLDIIILGHVIKACFVAKRDMIDWPVLGYLSTLQRTIFVDREKRNEVKRQREEMQDRMKRGDSLILFPEGTTSNGGTVLPFKSSLFGVTENYIHPKADEEGRPLELMVQPVTLVYKRIDNMPTNRMNRPRVAWYGDMEIGPHFDDFLKSQSVEVEVHFLEPVSRNLFKNRKELSSYCHRTIEKHLEERLRRVDD